MVMKFVLLAFVIGVVQSAPSGDEVQSLPGWDGDLPSRQYSGYVNLSLNDGYDMSVHYYYIEAETDVERVVLWSNGGPSASSMFGIMAELGPLVLNDDSLKTEAYNASGIPSLLRNEYAWTKFASVLMFDWAPPVGFSYCDNDPQGDGLSCGVWNDTRMALLEEAAVEAFFKDKFPELNQTDFYLVGESYAGVYIPLLAEKIMNYSNFKGFAVGDACAGTDVLCGSNDAPWWDLLFLYGHGQISNQAFDSILSICNGIDSLKRRGAVLSDDCSQALSNATQTVGWYYEYNLYDTCTYQEGLRRRRRLEALNDYPCGGGTVQDIWTNLSSVRKALHVPIDSYFFSADGDDTVYKVTEPDVRRVYRAAAQRGIKALVYNGDTDPSINSFNSQNWTSTLFPVKSNWRPWTLDNCKAVAGYVIEYNYNFAFLTIRGSGHMVPEFKPMAAYTFMSDWLNGAEFRIYNSVCDQPSLFTDSLSAVTLG